MGRREREKEEARERIIDAARELFANEGVEAVSMRRIAERAEWSAAALYNFFPDRSALLREICERDFQALAAQAVRIFKIEDPWQRLEKLGRSYIQFALDHPSSYRLMFMTPKPAGLSIDEGGHGIPERDAYAVLLKCVQDCIEAGLLRPDLADAEVVAQTLWAGVHGVASLQIVMREQKDWVAWRSVRARVDALMDLVTNGIRRR